MTRESLAFAIAGTLFGVLVGWIIGTQQLEPRPVAPVQQAAAAETPAQPAAAPLDEARAAELQARAKANPKDAAVRVELGNLYFDSRRFDLAAPWYEAALELEPKDVNVSTDLAVAYYSTNQIDRAIQQADRSLALDPKHVKTLLNKGIFLAFGRKDMTGAAEAWQRVVELAPDSEEGRLATQGLQGVESSRASAVGSSGGQR